MKLLKAVKEVKIKDCHQDAITGVLRYAMLKVGIRAANLPNDEETAILLLHIAENYGLHTPDEIRLAFDMAISGKLDLDHKDVVCYENFSCLYFSTIMNAYRKWANQAIDQIARETKPEQKALPPTEVNWGGEVEYYFQKLKSGEFISYMSYRVQLYGQMVKDGFVKHNPLYTDEQKKKAVFDQFEKDKVRREKYYEFVKHDA